MLCYAMLGYAMPARAAEQAEHGVSVGRNAEEDAADAQQGRRLPYREVFAI